MSEGSYEAKLHAFRRTQDGVVISYVVHPNDVSAAMATASLGTRYMIGFSEINETSVVQTGQNSSPLLAEDAGSMPANGTTKDRRPFTSLPLSQQAAMRCGDPEFQRFMVERYSGPHAYRPSADNAAVMVRERCSVASRADLDAIENRGAEWIRLDAEYRAWLTDQKYAGARR